MQMGRLKCYHVRILLLFALEFKNLAADKLFSELAILIKRRY
jgi:hypothetical protein